MSLNGPYNNSILTSAGGNSYGSNWEELDELVVYWVTGWSVVVVAFLTVEGVTVSVWEFYLEN